MMAMPLAIVVLVSMFKDAIEDYKRHKNDDKENNTIAQVYDVKSRSFADKLWRDIRVGEIVKVQSDEYLPCDLLLTSTSDPKGVCYVETKNLDGETNLKIKSV